jgi:hypothetical protein
MIDLNDPGLDDEFIEEAHEFEVDLNCTVVLNHRLTLDGIDHSEEEGFLKVRDMFAGRDNEALSSEMRHVTHFHDDLRRVANNLAVVGLVTRLQHWIIKLVRQLHDESKLPKPKKPKSRKPVSKKPELAIKLELLNERLGEGQHRNRRRRRTCLQYTYCRPVRTRIGRARSAVRNLEFLASLAEISACKQGTYEFRGTFRDADARRIPSPDNLRTLSPRSIRLSIT